MRKMTVTCDNPECQRDVELREAPNGAPVEAPRGWVVIKVTQPVRSYPFGTQPRTFCDWRCVGRWAEVLADTNGEGPRQGEWDRRWREVDAQMNARVTGEDR